MEARDSLVLCRQCANFTGRRVGPERRSAKRLCAAGLDTRFGAFACESHVPLHILRQGLRPARDSHA